MSVLSESTHSSPVQSEAKRTELLLRLVADRCEVFHDGKGTSYVLVKDNEKRVLMALRSRDFRTWLSYAAHRTHGFTFAGATVDEAITALDGRARFEGAVHDVCLRVAVHNERIYVDLGDASGDAIEIGADGWRVIQSPPVYFLRSKTMLPLPRPAVGGDIKVLYPFLNVKSEHDRVLVLAYLVACFRPNLPTPILCLHGEQGSGKSTLSRVVRSLVDPSALALRSVPRQEDDFFTATKHSHVLVYDNLSAIVPWLSDALCRLSTGGGIGKRQNYSDDEEIAISAIRPLIVNGIDNLPERADLAERCLVVEMNPITPSVRQDEEAFWQRFGEVAPSVLGALLTAVSVGLRNRHLVQLACAPRMADFARFQIAALPAVGVSEETFLAAYNGNRMHSVRASVEASPVANALLELMRNVPEWSGEPSELLERLSLVVPTRVWSDREWPKVPNLLTKHLRRHTTSLRELGILLNADGRKGERRWIEITKGVVTSSAPSTSATDAEKLSSGVLDGADGADGADGIPPVIQTLVADVSCRDAV